MDIFDQKQVLSTFGVLIDTREQDTPKARKRFNAFGCPFRRVTLSYGDYAYTAQLPDGSMINAESDRAIFPLCVVERKMSLDELAQCFTRDRERFVREFARAKANGAKVYLIVENATWEGIMNHRYKSRFAPNAFMASILAWLSRYDMNLIFCKEDSSGRLIKEILFRDLKERLERGEYG